MRILHLIQKTTSTINYILVQSTFNVYDVDACNIDYIERQNAARCFGKNYVNVQHHLQVMVKHLQTSLLLMSLLSSRWFSSSS